MERDQQGTRRPTGSFAIISTLAAAGPQEPGALLRRHRDPAGGAPRLFLGVIDAANRANVSIYTMDAAGLRAESEQAKIRDQVNQAGGVAAVGILAATAAAVRPLRRRSRRTRTSLRQDPRIRARASWRRTPAACSSTTPTTCARASTAIESDLRNYYLVGYTPTNEHLRRQVPHDRGQGEAPRRHGRRAQGLLRRPRPGGAPINAWEAPALGALEQKPVPNAFPVRAGALLFPERGRPGLVPVVVELKTAPLTFQPAHDGKTYTSDFTVLVRFLDEQNQVVAQGEPALRDQRADRARSSARSRER